MFQHFFVEKIFAGVKKIGLFTNEKYFSNFHYEITFSLRRKIFRKKIVVNTDQCFIKNILARLIHFDHLFKLSKWQKLLFGIFLQKACQNLNFHVLCVSKS